MVDPKTKPRRVPNPVRMEKVLLVRAAKEVQARAAKRTQKARAKMKEKVLDRRMPPTAKERLGKKIPMEKERVKEAQNSSHRTTETVRSKRTRLRTKRTARKSHQLRRSPTAIMSRTTWRGPLIKRRS